jgi:outer membrane protein assembly factor BamB
MGRAPKGEIVFTRGLLHAYSRDGTLSALHPVTGKKIWEYNLSPLRDGSPIFYEGSFYIKNKSGELFSIYYGPLKSPGQNSFVNLQKTGFSPGGIPDKITKINWSWRRKYHDKTPVSPVSKENLIYVVSGRKLIVLRDFPFVDKSSYFAGDLQRTGVFPGKLASSLPEEEWTFEAGEEITSSLAVGQKHIYVPAGKVLYALDYGGRETAWKYRGKQNFTVVQYYNGIVYAGTKGGKVIAISAENGEIIWQSDKSIIPLRISLSDGYLAAVNSKLQYAVYERQTGKLLWCDLSPKRPSYQNFNSSLEIGAPIISRGRIILQKIREPNYRNEKLFLKVVSAQTGQVIREIKINQGKRIGPCKTILLKGDKCYAIVEKRRSRNHLLAVNILTGKIEWKRKYQDQLVWASGAAMDKKEILIAGHHLKESLISLFLVNTEDGALIQRLNLSTGGENILALRPITVNNGIYIQDWRGTVFSLR